MGTWEARKGLATLHEALREVNAKQLHVHLVLAGKPGWGTERLLDQLRRDPAVQLHEQPDDERLARLYRDALALVYPSEMEGFGLPVAEAMACGCPVIATELPSVREFAADYPLYVEPGDSRAIAAHVECLLGARPAARDRRERARDAVSPLRWSAHGARVAELIEGLPRLAG